MAGIQIPIGGDMAPFLTVMAALQTEMRQLSGSIRSTLRPAQREGQSATAAIRTLWQSTSGASTGFRVMRTTVGAVGIAFRSMGSTALSVFSGILSGARRVISGIAGIGSTLKNAIPGGGMIGPLAGLAAVGGSIALLVSQFKSGADVAGNIEQINIALEGLTGSGDTAKKVLDSMRATWLRTGATIEQQGTSIRKFIALGFSPDQAIKLQNNLLDVAGAVGMTADQSELLASALAQVKAKGIVSMEELRQQIAEKGIPVFEALAAKMGVTQGALIKMVSEGKVPAQALLDIFMNMEGSFAKFVGGSTRMGMTFFGLISRLKGAWQLLMAEFAAPIIDSIKPILSNAITLIGTFKAQAEAAGKSVGNALLSAFALVKSGKTFELLRAGFAFAITGAMDILMRGLRSALAFLSTALPPIFEAAFAKLSDPQFWEGVAVFLRGAAAGFSAEIRAGLGQADLATALRRQAGLDQKLGSQLIGRAGGVDMGNVASQALVDGLKAALEAGGGPASDSFISAKDNLKALLATVAAEVAKLRKETAVPPSKPGAPSAAAPSDNTTLGAIKSAMTLTTSLGRIGGGGFGMTFSPMITEQKKGNTLLQQIANNTRTGTQVPAIA